MESNKNTYQLKQGKKEYILSTSLIRDLIRMNCKNKRGENFTRQFTLDEFNTLDEVFSTLKTPFQVIKFIDEIISREKVGVNEEDACIKIVIYLKNKGIIHQIEIPLDKTETDEILPSNNLDNMIDNAQTSNINNYFGTSENNSNLDSFQYIQTQFTNGGEINSTNISNGNGQDINFNNFDTNNVDQYFKTKYSQSSVPIPSSSSNQYLNSFKKNYDSTSAESSILPTPTLHVLNKQNTNVSQTSTKTFDMNEFAKSLPNTVPPVINDLMRKSLNKKINNINNLLRSPQVQTINSKIEINLKNKDNSIFTSPVTFSLPKRSSIKKGKTEIESELQLDPKIGLELQPRPSLDYNNIFQSQPEPKIDFFQSQTQEQVNLYQSQPQQQVDLNLSQSQPQQQESSFQSQQEQQINSYLSEPVQQIDSYKSQEQQQVDLNIFQSAPQQQLDLFQSQPQQQLDLNIFQSAPQQQLDLFQSQPQQQATSFQSQQEQQINSYFSKPVEQINSLLSDPLQQINSFQPNPQEQVTSFQSHQDQQINSYLSEPVQQINSFQSQQEQQINSYFSEPVQQIDSFKSQPEEQVNLFQSQPQQEVDLNTFHSQQEQIVSFQSQPQEQVDLNLFQSQPQDQIDSFQYQQHHNLFQDQLQQQIDPNLYKTQKQSKGTLEQIFKSPSIQQPQISHQIIQNQQQTTLTQNVYQPEKPQKYQFGITLFKSDNDDEYPTAKIEKINEISRTTKINEALSNNLTQQEIMVPNYNDDRINQLEGYTNSLKSENQQLEDKLNELSGVLNLYKNQIGAFEKEKSSNEVDALRAENKAIKQQLLELNRLRNTAAEVNVLRSQLAELKPLRKKVAEMEIIRGQVRELNELKKKVVDLDGVKAQIDELNKLKDEISQMNNFQSQLGELKSLKIQVAEAEELKRKIEEMEKERSQYEQEIQNLRTSQKIELLKMKNMANSFIGSKQLLFEDTTNNNMLVKGDIIRNIDELEMITRKINKSNNKIILNLLYKASADSDKAAVFHEKCDEAKSSLVLVETNKGKRFGGFTTCSWKGDCIDKQDEEAFIFSLDKMMTYDNISGEDAIGCYPRFGPIFLGCQIRIYDNAFTKGGTTFERGLNYNTEEDYELTDGERVFGIKDIEVYEVITQ